MSNRQAMSMLSGWANRRGIRVAISVAETAGFQVGHQDRGSYQEWRIERGGDTIGFLHEFADETFAFAFTGWPVKWWRRGWWWLRGRVPTRIIEPARPITTTRDL